MKSRRGRRRLELDRREVVLLGGLTGAAANLGLMPALAAEGTEPATCITAPITDKLIKCVSSSESVGLQCAVAYRRRHPLHLPPRPTPNQRPTSRAPAGPPHGRHVHQKKYEAGVRKMKALPDDDPRSFKSQAAIHEAYCNFHYKFVTATPAVDLDVHFSSVFAPWHRMYIYFFELILGDLLDDPRLRAPLLELGFHGRDGFTSHLREPRLSALRRETQPGEREIYHRYLNLGPGKQNGLVFYSHHANVDRLWRLWRLWRTSAGHADFVGDEDWLETSFVFFDEKRRPVRIR